MNDSNYGFWTAVSILISLAILGIWVSIEVLIMIGELSFIQYMQWGDILISLIITIPLTGIFIGYHRLWLKRRIRKLYNYNK